MLHVSETPYGYEPKAPLPPRSEQRGKTTLLLSELSVARESPLTTSDASVTQINEPTSRARVDGFFIRSLTTWAEGSADFDRNAAVTEMPDQSALVNSDRLVFLARKYARRYSKEEDARLEILTERVRAMLPRVTEEDFRCVAEIATELSNIHEENRKLLERLKRDSR
jgi:hypothetical protein